MKRLFESTCLSATSNITLGKGRRQVVTCIMAGRVQARENVSIWLESAFLKTNCNSMRFMFVSFQIPSKASFSASLWDTFNSSATPSKRPEANIDETFLHRVADK